MKAEKRRFKTRDGPGYQLCARSDHDQTTLEISSVVSENAMNSKPSPLVLTNQDRQLEMPGFVLTGNASTFRHIGDVQILESSFRVAGAKSWSHAKWGSTDGRRSNQEQIP
jgi:hypothetical protein